jgi:hypothetical protein
MSFIGCRPPKGPNIIMPWSPPFLREFDADRYVKMMELDKKY